MGRADDPAGPTILISQHQRGWLHFRSILEPSLSSFKPGFELRHNAKLAFLFSWNSVLLLSAACIAGSMNALSFNYTELNIYGTIKGCVALGLRAGNGRL